MRELRTNFPDPDVLLELAPEELAAKLVFLLRERGLDRPYHPSGLGDELWANTAELPQYPRERFDEINLAIAEAFAWLDAQGLAVPVSGMDGSTGYRRLSRRARRIENDADFTQYAVARRMPRDSLHPKLSKTVWMAVMRGEFDVAVFQAMKAVEVAVRDAVAVFQAMEKADEVAVRDAAKYLGVKLMGHAFNPEKGCLTDMETEDGERKARAALFVGAIGSYKNPHSHRDVKLDDASEAIEIVMLANHLLRIVDSREAAKG